MIWGFFPSACISNISKLFFLHPTINGDCKIFPDSPSKDDILAFNTLYLLPL